MPPRFVYWTILIDGKPTAFRARDQQDLLPTFNQLKRTNQDVVIKWFARGRLWDSPEAERNAERRPAFTGEKRTKDWRPGGTHKDPRDRFKKKNRPERAWTDKTDQGGPTHRDRPWRAKPPAGAGSGAQRWRDKPAGPPRGTPLDGSKPFGGRRPSGGATPRGPARPWTGKPRDPTPPWSAKPGGTSKPWENRPRAPHRRPFVPRARPPFRKRRDDEPDKD